MKNLTKRPLLILSFFLLSIVIFIRYQVLSLPNGDLALIQTWYDFLKQNGVMGLADGEFSNYPPAYLYLLWLSTLFLDSVPAIKFIPTLFDIVSAVTVYKIARIKFNDDKPYLFAAIFLLLPTVTLNSTGWGQIDSAYASFLLVCFYFLLKEKPLYAMLAFGIAFSFKAQSIFLLPFLGILFLRKQINWYYFFIIPIVYIVLALPTIFLGRSWESIILLYAGQVDQFENLSRYAPNLYFVIPNEFYHPIFEIGLGIFFISMLIWAWINWKAGDKVTQKQIAFTALASVALIPFLLPKMHDRYFYPADVFSYAVAILFPEIWFVPIMFQISSTIAYSVFLFGAQPIVVLIGSLINTALVIVILRKQIHSLKEG
ncbi:MAG: glycosyltransferase family 39 protein [Anaerolineales bacterium]|nr:glycosyltransferase family 39 protein [Anaerolineales bacterium]